MKNIASGQSRRTLRIATRGSALAMAQTQIVIDALRASSNIMYEIIPITTRGDQQVDRNIAAIGTDGVFVTELFAALLEDRADIAVHSLKDLPTNIPSEIACGAVLKREDARDVLISRGNQYATFEALPLGASVGTSSLRRAAQIMLARRDAKVVPLRGNVDTRVRKVVEGQLDAAILALAGLRRAGLLENVGGGRPLDFDTMVPAVGQGALFAQCRSSDYETAQLLDAINDPRSALATRMERALLARLGGGCLAPIGAHVEISDRTWRLWAIVAATDGTQALRRHASGSAQPAAEAILAVESVAESMLADGAREILAAARNAGEGNLKP